MRNFRRNYIRTQKKLPVTRNISPLQFVRFARTKEETKQDKKNCESFSKFTALFRCLFYKDKSWNVVSFVCYFASTDGTGRG